MESGVALPQNIIALVFDFDDTLTDDSTTVLLESVGIDPKDFWGKRCKRLIDEGWDPSLTYLKLLLDEVGKGRPFKKLTNKDLRQFGSTLKFYPGLPTLFSDLRQSVKEHTASNPVIEFYVVSGGLEEVIRGSLIAKHLSGIWGCQFAEEGGQIKHVRRLVTFTEKTRYLFQINKGMVGKDTGPYDVNKKVLTESRRIPFENMIYVGDGFTDVPCFSLVEHFGGRAFGVFDPKKKESPKKAWEQLLAPKRVSSLNSPKYRKTDELGSLLRMAVKTKCLDLDTRTGTVTR